MDPYVNIRITTLAFTLLIGTGTGIATGPEALLSLLLSEMHRCISAFFHSSNLSRMLVKLCQILVISRGLCHK